MQKKYFFSYIFIYLGLLSAIALAVYLVDPGQQFRYNKHISCEEARQFNEGIVTGGLIKTRDFDIAICGTSSSGGMMGPLIDEVFEKPGLKCNLSGSSYYEQELVFNAIAHHHPKTHIIYGLDYLSYNTHPGQKSSLEPYAYYDEPWLLHRYFFEQGTYRALLKTITNFNEKTEFAPSLYPSGAEIVLNPNTNGTQIQLKRFISKTHDLTLMKSAFDAFILNVKRHPHLQYSIYYPPYSIVWWLLMEQYSSIDDILEFKRYTVAQCSKHPNISIYDFQNEESIITDFDNYTDIFHYNEQLSRFILESIKDNTHILNSDNIDNILQIKEIINRERPRYANFVQQTISNFNKRMQGCSSN